MSSATPVLSPAVADQPQVPNRDACLPAGGSVTSDGAKAVDAAAGEEQKTTAAVVPVTVAGVTLAAAAAPAEGAIPGAGVAPVAAAAAAPAAATKKAGQDDNDPADLFAKLTTGKAPSTKGYRTRNPADGSEGDSDSENPDVAWRGLTPKDWTDIQAGRGLLASTNCASAGALYQEIHEHVSNGSDPAHGASCKLLSATRSKKVAARYAGDKLKPELPDPIGLMAKIRLGSNIKYIDLTLPGEMDKAGLHGTAKKWAENSQEMIIYGNVPPENITVYRVKGYKPWLQAKASDHADFVRFRAYETGKYPYKCYGIDPYTQ